MAVDYLIAQGFGLVSFVLGVSTFYQKDDRKLKLLMLVLNLNHFIHFLLLGSTVSAVSALLSAFRTATAIHVSSKCVAVFFILLSVVIGPMASDSLGQLWPVLGTIIGTYSVFVLRGIQMRIGFLLGATCWLINNILIGSIGGTMLELTVISVNLFTMFRLYRDSSYRLASSK